MNAPELYGGIGSLVVGLLFVVFSKPIGVGFSRIGKAVWKGHEDDIFGKVSQEFGRIIPFLSLEKIYNEAHAPKVFRFLGIVFLIQAAVFFILSAVT